MNLLDKLLFKSIDTLNKKGAHTNPLRIKENIRKFLEKTSKEFIGYLNNSSIGADIGSGYGILSDVLKPIRVYNLDINPPTSGYLPQIKGDAEKLPFKDNSLDFVLFFYSFPHFNNPKKAFEEAKRVLKYNGKFIAMMEFLRYPFQKRLIELNEISMNQIIYNEINQEKKNYFSKKDFEKWVNELNFKKINIKEYPPTRKIDIIFKTKKILYILEKQ